MSSKEEDPSRNIYEGIRLPSAYRLATPEEEYDWELRNRIRYFRRRFTFVYDPNNEQYASFLEQCKKDEKELRRALDQEFKARGIKLRVRNTRPRGEVKKWRKVNFFIRPPFTSTFKTGRPLGPPRARQRTGESHFYLHIDEDGVVDDFRYFGYGPIYFQAAIAHALKDELDFLSNHYGEWDVIAKKITDAVEKGYPALEGDVIIVEERYS